VPFLICRWSAVKVLSILLLSGAGGGGSHSGRLVVADESQLGCVDEKVGDVELLPVPCCLQVDGVDGAGQAGSGVDEACGERVDVLRFEIGGEGSEGCVFGVDGAGVAVEGDGAVGGEMRGDGEGEGFLEGEIFGIEVELAVGSPGSDRCAGSGLDSDG